MKRILEVAILVVMVATLFVGCKSKIPTFACDLCKEEKTGEKFVESVEGHNLTVCEACKIELNSKFTCQICNEEKSGDKQTIDVYGQKLTACKECKDNYELGLEILSGGTGDLEDALEGLEDFGYGF